MTPEKVDYVRQKVIKNLREAEKELKRGFPTSAGLHIQYCLMLLTDTNLCKHCGCPIEIRNLSGICDHMHYPEYCETCKEQPR